MIKPALEQVDGVASVEVKGGAEREVHVELDRAKIDALRLSTLGILDALKAQNLTVPAGHFDEGDREISVRTVGELKTVDEIRNLIVATAQDGSSVRLSDIARVEDGYEELRTRIRVNGEAAVTFDVLKQSGTNTVAVTDAVQAKLAAVAEDVPDGDAAPSSSSSRRASSRRTRTRSRSRSSSAARWRSSSSSSSCSTCARRSSARSRCRPASSPRSSSCTCCGFTLNMMTLLGLSLAIGLLIDDAVVVRENIFKHLERGEDPRSAALDGTKEIALSRARDHAHHRRRVRARSRS